MYVCAGERDFPLIKELLKGSMDWRLFRSPENSDKGIL